MIALLIVLQFVIVVVICIAALLQKSSSIGLGAYSGNNESLFGAKGPADFLAKFTFIVGLLFIVNTVALGYLYNSSNKNSLAEKVQIDSNATLPSLPVNISSAPSAPQLPSEINTSK